VPVRCVFIADSQVLPTEPTNSPLRRSLGAIKIRESSSKLVHWVSSFGFGLFCLLGFVLPVPLLAWLDRPRRRKD